MEKGNAVIVMEFKVMNPARGYQEYEVSPVFYVFFVLWLFTYYS